MLGRPILVDNNIISQVIIIYYSIDLTLSNNFRYYKPGLEVLDIKEDTNYETITEKQVLKEGESFLLLPGCACLGITEETIELSPKLCGLLGNSLPTFFYHLFF